ncbi:MAG TPA: hypothetical protein VGZ22_03530, partial [Isosphaeraceae bacterium]|nr:hypothetical protein [Isosphaeraceae bacterium]
MRAIAMGVTLGWLMIGSCSPEALADGGTLRVSERQGAYEVTVFTAPAFLRAGPVEISVLVQDSATGETAPESVV